MFGFGKKHSKAADDDSDELIDFLEEADKLYIRAFETRNISILKDFFTRECIRYISIWIVNEGRFRYFSNEKFRKTSWTVESKSTTQAILTKVCVYKDIHLNIGHTMKVSEDYKERWIVDITPDEFMVSAVNLIE